MPWTIAAEVRGTAPPPRHPESWVFVAELPPALGSPNDVGRSSWLLLDWEAKSPEAAAILAEDYARDCFGAERLIRAQARHSSRLPSGGRAAGRVASGDDRGESEARAKTAAFLERRGELEKFQGALWKGKEA